MLRRSDIDHILRAAASLTGHRRFVMVGTGAVIATARHIPVARLCAWREKDQAWLREVFRSGVVDANRVAALLGMELAAEAPASDKFARRVAMARRASPGRRGG